MPAYLIFLALFPLLSCSAPGPLATDRTPGELFGAAEENLIVVDAILIVDAPLPPIFLRRTTNPGASHATAETALRGARVAIHSDDAVFDYRPDADAAGRYLPPDGAPAIEPDRVYELHIDTGADSVRATTRTPQRLRIAEVLRFAQDPEQKEYREMGNLRLFAEIGDQVYQARENQLEYPWGVLEIRLEDGGGASYQYTASNLEHFSPLLFGNEFFAQEDLERGVISPLLSADDGAIYLSQLGIYYAGRQKVKLYAIDQNWFDLERTDNVDAESSSGEAGQSFQRPLFHIENGIGLFASAAVDSLGFFVRPAGSPECSGCQCWGCEERPTDWSVVLDPDTGSGRVRYQRRSCELSYAITGATAIEPCELCSSGWEFTLGELSLSHSEDGTCGAAAEASGLQLRLGPATELISQWGGAPKYGLYTYETDQMSWSRVKNGWSISPREGEYAGMWLFGFDEE